MTEDILAGLHPVNVELDRLRSQLALAEILAETARYTILAMEWESSDLGNALKAWDENKRSGK